MIAGLDSGGGIWHRPFWQGLDAAWKTDWQLAGGTLTNVSAASNDGSPIFAGITPYSRLAWYYPQTNQWQTVVLPHNPTGTLSASPR